MVAWSRCSPYGVDSGNYHVFQSQELYGIGGHDQHQPADEHHEPVHYSFHYDVHDPHTGDVKSQHETRTGDVVTGYYSLVEPDGTVRTVKYKADKHSGFNAIVDRKKSADFEAGHQLQHY